MLESSLYINQWCEWVRLTWASISCTWNGNESLLTVHNRSLSSDWEATRSKVPGTKRGQNIQLFTIMYMLHGRFSIKLKHYCLQLIRKNKCTCQIILLNQGNTLQLPVLNVLKRISPWFPYKFHAVRTPRFKQKLSVIHFYFVSTIMYFMITIPFLW